MTCAMWTGDGFRDIKDMRFGMGLSSMHVSRPDRRDRLLLISALAIAVLSLLGAAGERISGRTKNAEARAVLEDHDL